MTFESGDTSLKSVPHERISRLCSFFLSSIRLLCIPELALAVPIITVRFYKRLD